MKPDPQGWLNGAWAKNSVLWTKRRFWFTFPGVYNLSQQWAQNNNGIRERFCDLCSLRPCSMPPQKQVHVENGCDWNWSSSYSPGLRSSGTCSVPWMRWGYKGVPKRPKSHATPDKRKSKAPLTQKPPFSLDRWWLPCCPVTFGSPTQNPCYSTCSGC